MSITIGGKSVTPPPPEEPAPKLEVLLAWAGQCVMTINEARERIPKLEAILDSHEDDENWGHYYVELRISKKEIDQCEQRLSALAQSAGVLIGAMTDEQRAASLSAMDSTLEKLLRPSPFGSVLSALSPPNSTNSGTSDSDGWIDTPARSHRDGTRSTGS